MSLPHHRKPDFLEDSMTRYKMYLVLKLIHKKVFLVPCYDIDLIWHTHQVALLLFPSKVPLFSYFTVVLIYPS